MTRVGERTLWRGRAKKLLALVLGTVIGLAVAEIATRLFFPHLAYGYPKGMFLPDPDFGFRYRPNLDAGFLTKQEFSTRLWTNSKGFRDREREFEKADGTFRILSVGDSFTWGAYGVEAEETFSAVLERLLEERSSTGSYEVVNTGVFGYGTDNELRFYVAEGRQYNADLVLVNLFVGNDFYDNHRWGEVSVIDGNLVWTDSIPTGGGFSIGSLRNFLLKYSYLASAVEKSLFAIPIVQQLVEKMTLGGESQHVYGGERLKALIGPEGHPLYREMFGRTASLLEEFHREVRRDGARLAVVVIPAIYQLHPDIKEELYTRFGSDEEALLKAQRDLRQLGATTGFLVIDLLPGFEAEYRAGNRLYWRFNPHFNHHGNEVAARIILEQLLASGLVK